MGAYRPPYSDNYTSNLIQINNIKLVYISLNLVQ